MRILQSFKSSLGWFYNVTPEYLVNVGVPEPEARAALADMLKAEVDTDAEALRLRFVTPGAGQALEYQEARSQAAAALAVPQGASAELYPMLGATIGIDLDPLTGKPATDVLGVARGVAAAFDAFATIGAEIRRVRLTAKQNIDAAQTFAAAIAARDAVRWPVA